MLPLLQTKTSIPPARQNRVERPRLMECIEEGMKRTFTLILAPAGFGKTTLIAEWARSTSMSVAWLSLERSERAPERFLSYFIHALQQIAPQAGQTALTMLHSGQAMPQDAILASLLNDLNGIEGNFAVVLDDYHAAEGSEVNAGMQFLLEHSPAQMHLAIVTRVMPDLSFARLRARDQMVEINAADLRFTEEEVRAFLERMGAPLPPEQISHLNQSTEGWAVGLQLAGLTLARQPFDWNIPAGQAHIFDYLAEEVLRRETPEVQDFLKVSALFDRFCVPLCNHVFAASKFRALKLGEDRKGGDILSYIERANLFLVPLDSARTWFRYHALFTEFLRRQLSPEQTAELYRAASLWFEENNLLDEAIHYAVHAADHERTAALLETHYLDMIQRGEQSAALEWLGALPPEIMENRPRLWLAKGWGSVVTLNPPQAEACAEKAEALISLDRTSDQLKGEAKALRILAKVFAGKTVSIEEISSAFSLLLEENDFLHGLLHFNLSIHYVMLGETAKALESFAETLQTTKSLNNPLLSIISHVQIGEIRQMRGALGLAERAFQETIQYARETLGERTFLLAMPLISYSDLLREQNRFDEAVRHAEQGIAFAQLWLPIAGMDGQIALARIEAAQNRWNEAFARLEQAIQVAESSASVIDDTIAALQLARLNLLRGDLPKAHRLIQAYDLEKAGEGRYFHFWEMTQLTLLRAKTLSLQTDPSSAPVVLEALSTLIAEAERRERVTPVIEASVLRAYAHHAVAQHEAAVQSLSHAFALGAQCGYVRIFADEGRLLLHLIEQYRSNIRAPRAYVEEIHNLIHKELVNFQSPIPNYESRAASTGYALSPLTRRELDILQLLAAGKSNQEIAVERVLTVNTVKKHVANILQKLGVANRTQAVMLAKKQGWME